MQHKLFKAHQLALYLVTDRGCLKEKTLVEAVEEALKSGVTFLQYREKHLPWEARLAEASALKQLARDYNVPFVINDAVDLALAVDADGVHLGQSDVSPLAARKQLGPDKIIGVTARTVEEAKCAALEGADYLGSGAAFETGTKQDTRTIGPEGIRTICQSVELPVVAIGGIHEGNILGLKDTGIHGVAVVSAILAKSEPAQAVKALKKQVIALREPQAPQAQGGSR